MVSRRESAKNDEKKQYFYEVGNFFFPAPSVHYTIILHIRFNFRQFYRK